MQNISEEAQKKIEDEMNKESIVLVDERAIALRFSKLGYSLAMQERQWIKVNERLPEMHKNLWICLKTAHVRKAMRLFEDDSTWYDMGNKIHVNEIEYWQYEYKPLSPNE